MKVALVHDYLIQYGGAERVLEALMRIFPDAPIYTLLYDEARTGGRFRGRVRKTSFLNIGFVKRQHRPFIPFMPLAARLLRVDAGYDMIVSDSAGFAKGAGHAKHVFHIGYCHTPLRYAWETDSYFESPMFKKLFGPAFRYLRSWDYRAAQSPDVLLANSRYIAQKIKRYYGRDAAVVYPPVDGRTFYYDPAMRAGEYFLAVGRLLHYKRFDLVIDAFKLLGLPLKIVGSGPEEYAIKKRIGDASHIEFLPSVVREDELRSLYGGARALVFPQAEDFGLVAAEALSCGTPVIAFREGGALEIVEDGASGVFFDEQTPDRLMEAVGRFLAMKFDRRAISRRAGRFSVERFASEFASYIPLELR